VEYGKRCCGKKNEAAEEDIGWMDVYPGGGGGGVCVLLPCLTIDGQQISISFQKSNVQGTE
jgi:hypothetical protein